MTKRLSYTRLRDFHEYHARFLADSTVLCGYGLCRRMSSSTRSYSRNRITFVEKTWREWSYLDWRGRVMGSISQLLWRILWIFGIYQVSVWATIEFFFFFFAFLLTYWNCIYEYLSFKRVAGKTRDNNKYEFWENNIRSAGYLHWSRHYRSELSSSPIPNSWGDVLEKFVHFIRHYSLSLLHFSLFYNIPLL